jgi:hypothetical protein
MLLNANSRARPNHARTNWDRACCLLEAVRGNLFGDVETSKPLCLTGLIVQRAFFTYNLKVRP